MKAIKYKGYYFPPKMQERDGKGLRFSTHTVNSLLYILRYWKKDKQRCVVQAGGSYGVWPAMLSRYFQLIYTFEPDWVSFYYLGLNTSSQNVNKFQCALSDCTGLCDFTRHKFTCHKVESGKDSRVIPCIKIDDLNLSLCDAILLDVEGHEYRILSGAKQTIVLHHPLILVEIGKRKGGKNKVLDLLGSLKYKLIVEIDGDGIFIHEDMIWNPPPVDEAFRDMKVWYENER